MLISRLAAHLKIEVWLYPIFFKVQSTERHIVKGCSFRGKLEMADIVASLRNEALFWGLLTDYMYIYTLISVTGNSHMK